MVQQLIAQRKDNELAKKEGRKDFDDMEDEFMLREEQLQDDLFELVFEEERLVKAVLSQLEGIQDDALEAGVEPSRDFDPELLTALASIAALNHDAQAVEKALELLTEEDRERSREAVHNIKALLEWGDKMVLSMVEQKEFEEEKAEFYQNHPAGMQEVWRMNAFREMEEGTREPLNESRLHRPYKDALACWQKSDGERVPLGCHPGNSTLLLQPHTSPDGEKTGEHRLILFEGSAFEDSANRLNPCYEGVLCTSSRAAAAVSAADAGSADVAGAPEWRWSVCEKGEMPPPLRVAPFSPPSAGHGE
eukprot:g1770.t1